MSQVVNRLVCSEKEKQFIKVNKPFDIEVVENAPIVYVSKVKDLPTPLKFYVKYKNRDESKPLDLDIYMSFSDKLPSAHTSFDYYFKNPKKILLNSMNPQQIGAFNLFK
jgi:hypothetical protein